MGLAKDRYMEMTARGYYSVGDKYVCNRCFKDYAIKDFVRSMVFSEQCTYCGRDEFVSCSWMPQVRP